MGYEVDEGWWDSKYSPPKFWNRIVCVQPDCLPKISATMALIFCYFSNLKAFEEYISTFSGSCIVLIGPDESHQRYCDPPPFYLKNHDQWKIHSSCHNKANDAIVIYTRQWQNSFFESYFGAWTVLYREELQLGNMGLKLDIFFFKRGTSMFGKIHIHDVV